MTQNEIETILTRQREYYAAGHTLSYAARRGALRKLQDALRRHEADLSEALRQDLGKSAAESYMCEIGLTLSELSWMLRHLRGLMRRRTVPTPLAQFAALSFRSPSPYGSVLIMSPWNYPVLLTLDPLIDALAAGNTAVVKPSAYAPASAAVLAQIIEECFPPEYVCVVTGGRAENQALLHQKFDMIFLHRQQGRGQRGAALRSRAPDPCRAGTGRQKSLHRGTHSQDRPGGQAHRVWQIPQLRADLRSARLHFVRRRRARRAGRRAAKGDRSPVWRRPAAKPRLRQDHQRKALPPPAGAHRPRQVVCGGQGDEAALRIAPTILQDVTWDDAVMGEEIFGPILPVLTYDDLDAALAEIEARPHPLALYLFSEDKAVQRTVLDRCHFGGGCLNDTIIHLATSAMPFGGVGDSGMGGYHGKAGFEAFSHLRSIVDKKTWMDMPVRYQPYGTLKDRLLRVFLR